MSTPAYMPPPIGLPSRPPRKPGSKKARGLWSRVKAWLATPVSPRLDGDTSRGAVLAGLATIVAAGVAVALYDRRFAVKEELEEGPGSSKAELKAAARDAKSSARHLKGAVEKAVK